MNKRMIELQTSTGWQEIEFKNLKKDDYFKITDIEDDKVEYSGCFIADDNAFLNENNIWSIVAEHDENINKDGE